MIINPAKINTKHNLSFTLKSTEINEYKFRHSSLKTLLSYLLLCNILR